MKPSPHPGQFLRRAAGLLLTQLGAAAFVLLANVWTARALVPAEQGRLTAAVAGFWLVTLVAGLGTPTALAAQVARGTQAPADTLRQAARLAATLGGAGGCLVLAVWGREVAPLALAVPVALLGQLLGCALLGRGDARAFRWLQLVPALAAAALAAACLAGPRPQLAWWAVAATQACTAAAAGWALLRGPVARATSGASGTAPTPTRPSHSIAPWWRQDAALLRLGAPVVAGQLLVNLGLRGDFLLLGILVPPAQVACYGVAKQVVERLALVAQATAPLAFAATAARLGEASHSLTPLACRVSFAMTALAALAVAAAAPTLVPALFGPAYADAVALMWPLLPAMVVGNVGQVLGQDLMARGRAADVLRCCALGLACNLAAFAWLTPTRGIAGAALASALATAVEAAAKGVAFSARTGLPFAELWLVRRHDVAALRTCRRPACAP